LVKKLQADLHGVGQRFAYNPVRCLKSKPARNAIREYDLDWSALVRGLRELLPPGAEDDRLVERLADFLAGYRLIRDMESQVKGVQKGGFGHGSLSLGRGFRKKLPILDSDGEKIGMVSIRDVLGNADFTPMVTARLKTRLIAEMMKDLEQRQYPKWWVWEFLPKAWQLVGESFKADSPSRVLRRAKKHRQDP
jgi:hypothetical protein